VDFTSAIGALAAGAMVEHYRVSRLIGKGGMGEVYLARDTRLGRRVALKLVRPDALGDDETLKRFLFEAEVTARFNHPHIVTIYGVGEHDGRPYVALEYLSGQSLRERLQGPRMGVREAIRMGMAIAEALVEAHANHVLHRDLKPENVMVPTDGRLRVVDFGLAKPIDAVGLCEAATVALGGAERHEATLPSLDSRVLHQSREGALRGTPLYMAPEQWWGEPVSAAADVWALGLVLLEMLAGRHPYEGLSLIQLCARVCSGDDVPWSDADDEIPSDVGAILRACVAKKPDRRPSAANVVETLRGWLEPGTVLLGAAEPPFRGLMAFAEQHAAWFFGRETEIVEALERLRREAVLPVVGPSGAGKSSFVQAGLVPRLREKGRLVTLTLRPGERPFDALASRIVQAMSMSTPGTSPFSNTHGTREEGRTLAVALESAPARLAIELQKVAARTGAQVVLLVDQLEEVSTLVERAETRRAFMEAVCGAADDPSEAVRVIFTLRDDFLGKLGETSMVRRTLGRSLLLRSPGEELLREIVSRPVTLAGYRYEDAGLVDGMLAAVRGEPACLPLLQFACTQLWEGRDKSVRILRRATYEAIGGVEGALARHADGVIEAMSGEQARDAKRLLLRMVTPERTRRTTKRSMLLEGLGQEAGAVLDRLVESRVIVSRKGRGDEGQETELAHESLILGWDRLSRWIDEGREEIAFLSEARQAAELWEKRGRARQEVWRGEALQTARLRAGHVDPLPDLVREFLAAGEDEERRAQKRRRVAVTGAFAVLGVVAAMAVVVSLALRSREQTALRERANAERKRAEALFEGARAALERSDPVVARAQLRSALEIDDSLAARALWPLVHRPSAMWSISLGSPLVAVEALRDGKSVVAVGNSGGFVVDLTSLEVTRKPELKGTYSLELCPDGVTLVSGTKDGAVVALPLPQGEPRLLGRLQGAVRSVACSGDSRRVVASGEKEIRVWDSNSPGDGEVVDSCESRCPVAAFTHEVVYSSGERLLVRPLDLSRPAALLATRPGGFARIRAARSDGTIVAQSPDGTVISWGADRALRHAFPWNTTAVSALSVDVEGRHAGACDAVECAVWAVRTGEVLARGKVPQVPFPRSSAFVGAMGAIAFVPDSAGKLFVWPWSHAGRTAIWSDTGEASFSPSGSEVASASQAGGVSVRSLVSARQTRTLPTRSYAAAFDPSGSHLFVSALDGNVEVWDARTSQRIGVVAVHRGYAYNAAVQPGGRLVASSGVDGNLRLFDATTLEFVGHPMRHTGTALSVSFSPDGRTLASASWDRTVRIWDVATQEPKKVLPIHALGMVARFSPDGSRVAASMRGGDGVAVWRTRDWTREPTPPRPGPSNIYGLAFHPDGERLLLGPIDGVPRIWNLRTGHTVELRGHGEAINRVEFSPDGRLALSTSDDGTTRTWDCDTGRPYWRAPLLLSGPARALTQEGWIGLANVDAPPGPLDSRWAKAVHAFARRASGDTPLTHVCIQSHDSELRIWDTLTDRESLVLRLPGLSRVVAAASGCVVLVQDEARLISQAGTSTLLAASATAIAADKENLLVAAGQDAIAFDPLGKRVGEWRVGPGVSALARVAGRLVAGRQSGELAHVALAPDALPGAPSFEGGFAVPVDALAEGPRGTVVAGYRNGAVGIWDQDSGRRLDVWYLHGPATNLFVDGTTLYAVSELADPLKEDLSVLEREYCGLMREIWQTVPVVWESGRTVRREPPAEHPCNRGL